MRPGRTPAAGYVGGEAHGDLVRCRYKSRLRNSGTQAASSELRALLCSIGATLLFTTGCKVSITLLALWVAAGGVTDDPTRVDDLNLGHRLALAAAFYAAVYGNRESRMEARGGQGEQPVATEVQDDGQPTDLDSSAGAGSDGGKAGGTRLGHALFGAHRWGSSNIGRFVIGSRSTCVACDEH